MDSNSILSPGGNGPRAGGAACLRAQALAARGWADKLARIAVAQDHQLADSLIR